MRGQLLEDMRKAQEEVKKLATSNDYYVWLTVNGMPNLQALVVSQLMYEEQLPMSVPVVLGLINPLVSVSTHLQEIN